MKKVYAILIFCALALVGLMFLPAQDIKNGSVKQKNAGFVFAQKVLDTKIISQKGNDGTVSIAQKRDFDTNNSSPFAKYNFLNIFQTNLKISYILNNNFDKISKIEKGNNPRAP